MPSKERPDRPKIHGIIRTSSTSKTKYNNAIKKYCKSNTELNPNGSKPHSYCEVFSKERTVYVKLVTKNQRKKTNKKRTKKYDTKKEYSFNQ